MEAMKWDDDSMQIIDSSPGEMNPVKGERGRERRKEGDKESEREREN